MSGRVTLLTDFGTRDGYAGAVKGVLAREAPESVLDDVSHDLPRGDVAAARYALGRYWRLYPGGTVHLVVVDPGVGTARRALACEADRRFVVAPDNGCLTAVLEEAAGWRAVEILGPPVSAPLPRGPSATFHGRDLFAPAAAYLARGGALEGLGPPVLDPTRLEEPRPIRDGQGGAGVVVAVDRFGNLLTNVPGEWLSGGRSGRVEVEVAGCAVPALRTYGDVEPGEALALVASDGRVEIAVREGSAEELLGAAVGTPVRVLTRTSGPPNA